MEPVLKSKFTIPTEMSSSLSDEAKKVAYDPFVVGSTMKYKKGVQPDDEEILYYPNDKFAFHLC